jgi:hypothetical protein
VPFAGAPAGAPPLLAREEAIAQSAPEPVAAVQPAAPPAPAAPPGPDIDEIYEGVVERLKRDVLAERERMGDLLGDILG